MAAQNMSHNIYLQLKTTYKQSGETTEEIDLKLVSYCDVPVFRKLIPLFLSSDTTLHSLGSSRVTQQMRIQTKYIPHVVSSNFKQGAKYTEFPSQKQRLLRH